MKPCPILCALLLTGALQAQEATNTAPEIDLETAEPGGPGADAPGAPDSVPRGVRAAQPVAGGDHAGGARLCPGPRAGRESGGEGEIQGAVVTLAVVR